MLGLVLLITGCQSWGPTPDGPTTPTNPSGGPATSVPGTPDGSPDVEVPLAEAMTAARVREHMAALQGIADSHDGNRAVGTAGYRASVEHVRTALERAGYRTSLQEFEYRAERVVAATAEVVEGPPVTVRPTVMTGSPSTPGAITAALTVAGAPLGCSAADYQGVSESIVLVERGTCPFAVKAELAAQAGAAAVLVHDNQPSTDGFRGTVGRGDDTVPIAGIAREQGMALREAVAGGPVRLRLDLRVEESPGTSTNVIADWPDDGPSDEVVMVGAHLDSVPAGPGINDNGSGVALVLATAEVLAVHGDPRGLRLGFWGAEEIGLLGSRHHVGGLDDAARSRVAAYLNFDMVASTNGTYGLYGEGVGADALARAFADHDVEPTRADIGGASDHAPFADAGIPVAGVFTGAGADKSASEAERHGGTAGEPYDSCYHRACDTLATVDTSAVLQRVEVIGDVTVEAVRALLQDYAR